MLAVALTAACGGSTVPPAPPPVDPKSAAETMTADEMMAHIKVLSSDQYEGRAPGTAGEDLTVAYLTEQFSRLGLKPGNPDGTYRQQATFIGITSKSKASLTAGGKVMNLAFPGDYVAVSRRLSPEIKVESSDVVFVGYGVVAPEYGWDDYKGVDVKGKTIIMLINDPAVPDPNDPGKLDDTLFRGRAMTYYGRWTYKYEIASEKGAAAVIIVHETGPAGYPWEVVAGGWGRENMDIKSAEAGSSRVPVEGWIHVDRAKELFAASGHDFEALKTAAVTKAFTPVALGAKASFTVENTVREFQSSNVVAKLEGGDPVLKDEIVVYMGHWDHLGRNLDLAGDQIFNGAADNASGIAAILEIAEAYTKLQPPPKRSILFMAVTGEESGLLGAKHYANNPLYPLERTLAVFNIDSLNQWGRTKDIVLVGRGNSTLDEVMTSAAADQGRVVKDDPEPEKGFFYRSDHFEFAKKGVPAMYADPGIDYIGKPEGYGQQKREEYTANDYHKVSDEVKPDWDLSGAVEDAQLLFLAGLRVAQADTWPEWKPGTEFRTLREEMLKKAGHAR